MEVDCRIIPKLDGKCQLNEIASNWRIIQGTTGEDFYITKDVCPEEVRDSLIELKRTGIDSIAIVLAHSYAFAEHEKVIGRIAKELGRYV